MTYTLDDILAAWVDYEKAKAISVLKAGEWKNTPLLPGADTREHVAGSTQARLRPLKDVMSFPVYMERHWKIK